MAAIDLALFPGMLHVLLRDGLENRAFIDAYTTGFDAVAESVKAYDPRRAADLSGVPPAAARGDDARPLG